MGNWPADQVERWSLNRLKPYDRNARTHSEAQIAQIAASMLEWGWTNPVLVDESGMIIAGHGRILAAQQLGYEDAPVMVARGWTDEQKRAYVLADNKLALNAGWDSEILATELAELGEAGVDLGLIGFSDDELADVMSSKTVGLTDPDEVPEPPETAVSELGDVWLLGGGTGLCAAIAQPWSRSIRR